MALTNYVVPAGAGATETPIQYSTMCIGNSVSCSSLERNYCVTFLYLNGYAGICTNGSQAIVSNNSACNCFSPAGFVIPKGCCLTGNCCSTLSGFFFGD